MGAPMKETPTVKKYMLLMFGFETPTPEIMKAWGKWFEEIRDKVVEKGHFPRGREISKAGARDLPLGPDAITGYVVVSAADFEEAAKMAAGNPFISSIRIYELRAG